MPLTLTIPPGFADLDDAALAQDLPAFAIYLARIYSNAAFGMVRTEVFQGVYKNGDTVPLPTSPTDAYPYSRNELTYVWTVANSVNPASGWISGVNQTLWYCAWFVDQATGNVYSDEWYDTSGSHPNPTHTNDGSLFVFTIAQRQRTNLIMAASAAYAGISGGTVATDKPFTQLLAQSLNDDAKFSVVNSEVIYLGEFYNGQTVPQPVSPADGYVYGYSECQFMFSWRWTATGNSTVLVQPATTVGQLAMIQAAVNSSGVVSIHIWYVDNVGGLYDANGSGQTEGRIAVFAFCQRSATPGTLPLANSFAEIDFNFFMPGSTLEASPIVQDIVNDINEAILTPEFFGPTAYADASTVPVPTSPVDGYVYSRSELTYIWSWSDTTNQVPYHNRVPLFLGQINSTTGVVGLNVWRLPPGGPYVDDNNTLCRISVIVVARRQAQLPAVAPPGTNPQSGVGSVVTDIPTLGGVVIDKTPSGTLGGSVNGSNTTFTLSTTPAAMLMVAWNGQVRTDFTQSGTTLTTAFTPDTGDTLVAYYFT